MWAMSKKEFEAKMLEEHPNQCSKCKVWHNSETHYGKDGNLCIKCRNDDELRNKGYVVNAIEKLQCSVCGSKIFENDICYCDVNRGLK